MKYDPACLFPSGQQPKAEPMFDRYFAYSDGHIEKDEAGDWVKWNDLQAKIASGELMVVRTARLEKISGVGNSRCSNCHEEFNLHFFEPEVGEHCPVCASKIIP